ncbi:MAG TPA: hypothetical protein VEH27_14935 [Methylomirabilota bacterium]|nr:hypothetical protein [Methylomirabilota bacterium]
MKALKLCLLLWAALLAAANDELDSWYQPPESAWVKRMSGVAFGEGKWVIGGENAWKSEDGTNWVQTREGFGCNKVIYGLGQFVAFGHSTPSGIRYATSKTGDDWTFRTLARNEALSFQFVFDGAAFLVANNADIYRSSDAVTWSKVPITLPEGNFRGASGGRYWASNLQGLWTTTNLTDWTKCDINSGFTGPVHYAKGKYYSAYGSALYYSTNGVNWRYVKLEKGITSFAVHDEAILVGAGSEILSSRDGESWTVRLRDLNSRFSGLASNGRQVVAVGDYWAFFTSAERPLLAPQIEVGIRAVVSIKGGRGRTYEIQSREDAASGEWATEEVLQVSSEDFVWTDPKPLNNRKIYRAVAR